MNLKTNDFVWIWNGVNESLDWGVVIGDKIVLQFGGFEDIDDFDENLVCKDSYDYYIGAIVRNASSFASAKAFYEHWVNGDDRFINHHTEMEVISIGDDYCVERDKEIYLKATRGFYKMTINELQSIFGQKICIVTE